MSQQNESTELCTSNNVQTFFDDEMDAAMHRLMRAHLADCAVCAAELRALQHLNTLMGLAFGFTSDLTQALQRYPITSH